MRKLSPTNAILQRLTVGKFYDGVTATVHLDHVIIGKMFRAGNRYEVRLADTAIPTPGGGSNTKTALRSVAVALNLREVESEKARADGVREAPVEDRPAHAETERRRGTDPGRHEQS